MHHYCACRIAEKCPPDTVAVLIYSITTSTGDLFETHQHFTQICEAEVFCSLENLQVFDVSSTTDAKKIAHRTGCATICYRIQERQVFLHKITPPPPPAASYYSSLEPSMTEEWQEVCSHPDSTQPNSTAEIPTRHSSKRPLHSVHTP